uniref:Putative secreted protein n=1 Tax=Ixodes ricinus TaxID=34613 RepID=A0A6B0U6E2_IXORI
MFILIIAVVGMLRQLRLAAPIHRCCYILLQLGVFLLKLRHPCSKGTFPRPKIANSSLSPQNEHQVAQVTGKYEGSTIESQDEPDERQPIANRIQS